MQILGKSYQVLSDPLQRDAYDRNEKKKKLLKICISCYFYMLALVMKTLLVVLLNYFHITIKE